MDAFRSLVKNKAKENVKEEGNTERDKDLVKMPGQTKFQKSVIDRFKSSIKIQYEEEEEEEVKHEPSACEKISDSIQRVLDFFVKLRLFFKLLYIAFPIAFVTMMVVVSASSTVWELSSIEVKDRMIELIQDSANDQVSRLANSMIEEYEVYFAFQSDMLDLYGQFVQQAFDGNPQNSLEAIHWSTEIQWINHENEDLEINYEWPAYFSSEQNKARTLEDYHETIEHLKNLHDQYINMPRVGAFYLFIGEEEGGIYQQYPATTVEANYNFKSREWYWRAAEKQGAVVVSRPYYDPAFNRLIITISKAIFDHNGKLLRVIGMDFSVENHAQLSVPHPNYNSFSFLCSDVAQVISTTDNTPWGFKLGQGDHYMPFIIYLQPLTGISKEDWDEMIFKDKDIDIKIPNEGDFTCWKNEINILSTQFYLVSCYEPDTIAEDYEEGLYEYRPVHILFDLITFCLVLLSILSFFIYYTLIKLNKNRVQIREITSRLIKNSIHPQIFGDKLYDKIQKESRTDLMKRLSKKLEEVRQLELKNLHWNRESWSRPINHYRYQDWGNQNHPRNASQTSTKIQHKLEQLRAFCQMLPDSKRQASRFPTIMMPSQTTLMAAMTK